MRRIVLTGRLTKDPEYRELTSKEDKDRTLDRLTFSLANNDNGKDAPGEFYDVVLWGPLAVWGNQYLKKGNRILISGTPHNEVYEKDGMKRTHFKIQGERVELMGG